MLDSDTISIYQVQYQAPDIQANAGQLPYNFFQLLFHY